MYKKGTSLSLSGKNDVSTSGFFPGFFFFSGTTEEKKNITLKERVAHRDITSHCSANKFVYDNKNSLGFPLPSSSSSSSRLNDNAEEGFNLAFFCFRFEDSL